MEHYNPRTSVFSYGGAIPPRKREKYALEGFCWAMQRRGVAVNVVDDDTRAAVVKDVQGAPVDGVLNTPEGHVAVELLGYSPPGDRVDVMGLDIKFRRFVKEQLYDDLASLPRHLSIDYRHARRPDNSQKKSVPEPRSFGAIVDELRCVLGDAGPLGFNEFLHLWFMTPEQARRVGRRGNLIYLSSDLYPASAEYLRRVTLQGIRDWMIPHVDSDLRFGMVGVNSDWIVEKVAQKARLSRTLSRERANGLPLWLVIHSDGHAPHQSVPEPMREYAMNVCREELTGADHGFQRAYWVDRVAFVDAAWVGRVV